MCFHLYSPGKQIEVTYVNESVRLLFTGSSKVSGLIVLQNKSKNEELEELFLLYPNSFYSGWNEQLQEFKKRFPHKDHTGELRDEKSPKHYPYTKDSKRGFTSSHNEVTITEFDPTQKDKRLNYSASLRETVGFNKYIPENVGEEGFKLLQWLGVTIFKFHFVPPIPAEGTRALKVFFRPKRTAVSEQITWKKRLVEWFPKMPMIFEFMGPFDVVKLFKEKCSYTGSLRLPVNLDWEFYEDFARILRREYIENGLEAENTSTVFCDYRLQISCDRWMDLFRKIRPTEEGQIFRCEPFPDYFFSEKGRLETVYQYFTGGNYLEDSPDEFRFRILVHT